MVGRSHHQRRAQCASVVPAPARQRT
jgi:hypothetical protein